MSRRLGLRTQLLLVSLAIPALPWLAWSAFDTVDEFLLEGQLRAVSLTAHGVAALLADHVVPTPEEEGADALYAWPLAEAPNVDGYPGDWESHPGAPELLRAPPLGPPAAATVLALRLGVLDGVLYGLAQVADPEVVFRHPGIAALGRSDQLRLRLDTPDGTHRLVLAADGPGRLRSFPVDRRWRHAASSMPPGFQAAWQPNAGGYSVEFRWRLPDDARPDRLWLGLLDVDAGTRDPVAELATGGDAGNPRSRLLRYRMPAIERLLASLDALPGRTWVTDRNGWVLASVGTSSGMDTPMARLPVRLLGAALSGGTSARRAELPVGETLVATAALRSAAGIAGAVLVEQPVDQLVRLRYRTFVELALIAFGLFILVLLALLLFASRLAFRIRRLGREAGQAIDAKGRLRETRLAAEADTADELGDLSRTVTALLGRLQRHTRFLRGLPHTLRHELGNPLNTLATALHNLAEDGPERARYLASAERGLQRTERILAALTEAASLDEALQEESYVPLDFEALLAGYLENFALLYPGRLAPPRLDAAGGWIIGNDTRLEQLLDKLLDNAIDFTPASGRITVSTRGEDGWLVLSVDNDGPPLPATVREASFTAMVSQRGTSEGSVPHLGIGLYVAGRIVDAHGGGIAIADRPEGDGVSVTVRLPRLDKARQARLK